MSNRLLHVGLCVQEPPYNAMQQAFIDNFSDYAEINCGLHSIDQRIINKAKEFLPTIVFFQIQNAGIINPLTVKILKELGAKVYNWTGDVRAPLPFWFKQFGADVTLFSNMKDVREMQQAGFKSDYLEIGFDPNIYNAEGVVKKVEPIVFFGNHYGTMFPMSAFRMNMVADLKSRYGVHFGVYGTGWGPRASGNFNSSQKEEAAAYRGSKIAINCSHFEIERYSSDRLLRILGTGTPICLAKYYPGIELDFEDGTHLRYWRTIEELHNLIGYYSNPENELERREIALNGMIHARANFTFDNMVKNLIKLHEKHTTI